ncbi:hypothetical protein SCHPADRAFT_505778 [Schizopora paradoxa]|uniref:Uncharacterized protein n=1 Tax=Schizopora paradoxa TaxID=27342 RepID=A0A0H2RGK4_9AGAM|nr:hypothetical protein SCHPADRAFT_505778 [Schizopora paradoxa]
MPASCSTSITVKRKKRRKNVRPALHASVRRVVQVISHLRSMEGSLSARVGVSAAGWLMHIVMPVFPQRRRPDSVVLPHALNILDTSRIHWHGLLLTATHMRPHGRWKKCYCTRYQIIFLMHICIPLARKVRVNARKGKEPPSGRGNFGGRQEIDVDREAMEERTRGRTGLGSED